jgi:hypothetical protein
MESVLTSTVVEKQLPDFIRSEHPKFVTFLKKYYEWLESSTAFTGIDVTSGANYALSGLKDSIDIDDANSDYLDLLKRDLLPYFPENIVTDKRLFLKLISHFYKSNGTPDSVKFLFRALYNENIDIYYPKEDILKSSDGKWVLPLALRIEPLSNSQYVFNIEKTKVTGQTSKATALVEKVIQSVDRQLGIQYTELYISNIERLFATGEILSATFNNGTSDITVTARLIGALSQITIDPLNRGLYYQSYDPDTGYDGDPVTIIGGLNPLANNPIGALAYVGSTTKGGVTGIEVTNGGFGFRAISEISSSYTSNVAILDFTGGFEEATSGTEAKAHIDLIDGSLSRTINLSAMSIETMNGLYANVNVATNAVASIANIPSYQAFNVYPILYVALDGSGGGYRNKPELNAFSFYTEDNPDVLVISSCSITAGTNYIQDLTQNLTLSFEVGSLARVHKTTGNSTFEDILEVTGVTTNTISFQNNFDRGSTGVKVSKLTRNDLYKIGSLGRIKINSGGTGYAVNQVLVFNGGSGYGANAFVSQVHAANTGIKAVTMNAHSTGAFRLGGEGYTRDALPIITVNGAGANASLTISEVLGDGETFSLTTSRIGAISTLRVISPGYDYVSAPLISLRNMDLSVANVTPNQIFTANSKVYQGTSNTSPTFTAHVDQFDQDTGFLRLYDYSGGGTGGAPSTTEKLKSDDGLTEADIITTPIIYGDGRAKATAKFENGLIRYPGLYLNTDGQVSADKVLQDGDKYHNFSYEITSQTDYATFKKPLNDIVHPVGTKIFATRVVDNTESISQTEANTVITVNTLPVNFNITATANSTSNATANLNLMNYVNVGDILIFTGVYKWITNTVNVQAGSNTVFGANSNFINDLIDGDIIYLSTGNTETVTVSNTNYLTTQNTIGVTATGVTINVYFDESKTVTFVNANTIKVDTLFTANSNFVVTNVLKVK